jgi:hypothetical protein
MSEVFKVPATRTMRVFFSWRIPGTTAKLEMASSPGPFRGRDLIQAWWWSFLADGAGGRFSGRPAASRGDL